MIESMISKKILKWYDLNKRDLPWRKKCSKSKKEYYTLISEFMLQQTQVATVIPYFNRFIKILPTIEKLSKVDNSKLFKLWEGLGYYSRARNLKKTAQVIVKKHNKKIPNNFEDLLSLPGIGNYTASAILSIGFNKPYIPLDGNIERVLKRYLLLKKENQITKEYLNKTKSIFGTTRRSSDYAQALMELGATICKPFNPVCDMCPINHNCKALIKKDFTLKKILKKNKKKFFVVNVHKKNNKYFLIKNNTFNFLRNLKIFPMKEVRYDKRFKKHLNIKLSNMDMAIQIKKTEKKQNSPVHYWIDPKKVQEIVLPSFTKRILKELETT